MALNNIEVTISKELVPYLYTIQAGETVQDKVTLSVVIGLFVSGTITLEKAAELAGKSIWDFIDILKICKIPWGEYTEEELEMDVLRASGYRISESLYKQILVRNGEMSDAE